MELMDNLSSTRTKLIAGVVFLLVFSLVYIDSLTVLFKLWAGLEQTIYRYGFLVLACSCYLLYLKRVQFRELIANPNWWALLFSLILASAWFVSSLAGVQTVQLAVLPILLLAMLTAFYGTSFLRIAGLPILLLLFAIPLWWPLLPFLKDATTLSTELFLRFIGKAVFVEGYFLHLPGGSFFVDDGCAGLRFLLVTLILAFMGIDMHALNLKQSAVLLGVGILMALVANWVRVIVVVLVGDYTRMEHRLVTDHNDLGWLVYGLLVLLPFFFLIGRFTIKDVDQSTEPYHPAERLGGSSNRFIANYSIVFVILMAGPALSAVVRFQEYPIRVVSLPSATESWMEAPSQESNWRANYLEADNYLYSKFQGESGLVDLHVVNYASQEEGVELINVDNTLTDGERWDTTPNTQELVDVETNSGEAVTVLAVEIESLQGQRKLVWYWYEIGARSTTNTYTAKAYQLLGLFDGRKDGSLIAIAADCGFNCAQPKISIENFIREMYSGIRSGI